jgi:catechol 2,3-dioxygenase-like lactoylglutathione lyase family enzyme
MPTLETYRKQAKLLLRWHREGDYSVGGRVRQLERFHALTDREVLALKFTLTLAQEIVAVEAGRRNWAELKAAAAGAAKTHRVSPGPPCLRDVIPILLVRDVPGSAAFFKDKLGFEVDFLHGSPAFYGAVSRDDVCLHLRFVHRPFFAQAAAREKSLIVASIQVSNVQALFDEFKARGVEFVQRVKKQAWGGTDFHVRDPDGNVISFVTYDRRG